MHKNAIKFRDTWVAPGSDMFEAIQAGDRAKAERLYIEGEIQLRVAQGERPEDVYECLPGGALRLLTMYDRVLRGMDGPLLKDPLHAVKTNTC